MLTYSLGSKFEIVDRTTTNERSCLDTARYVTMREALASPRSCLEHYGFSPHYWEFPGSTLQGAVRD